MAIVSRISTLRFDNGLGAFRQWVATAAIQDTAEGASVDVTVVQTSGGLAPSVADTLTLNFYNTAGALIRAATLTAGSGSQTVTFHFTDTGNSGGANRHDIAMIDIRATKTTGGPAATYDYETDGSPATPPSTFTASPVDRGYIRGTTTATLSASNLSAGGGQNLPASFPDSLFVRATASSQSYANRAQTLELKEGATVKRTAASASGAGPVWDVSFTGTSTATGRVNDGLSASSHTLTSSITVPNDATTGIAYTVLTSTTAGTITTDPRRRRQPLFQLDDNTFGTPPSTKHVASQKRLNTQQGFLASRTINARGEGQNGITYNVALTPRKPGSAVSQTGLTTTTQGGETGWAPSFLSWASGLPGGLWDKTFAITAPSDATNAAHTIQFAGSSTEYTLVAPDPNIQMRPHLNKRDGNPRRHFTAGGAILANFFIEDLATFTKVPASRITNPKVSVRHRNSTTEKVYFLKSDTATTFADAWEEWDGVNEAATYFPMTETTIGTVGFFVKLFSFTSAWDRDISAAFVCEVDGSPYSTVAMREETGDINPHDGQAADEVTMLDTGRPGLK